jgi:hypothetical protein
LRIRGGSDVGRGRARIRVLVAIEEEYRSYRDVIAACIRLLRPHVEVSSTTLEGLRRKAASLAPQLIVSSRARTAIPSPPIAWITIPTDDPTKPTEVWLAEERWKAAELETNVVGLLERVIDRAEEALAAAGDPNAPLARPEGSEDITRHEDRTSLLSPPLRGARLQHPINKVNSELRLLWPFACLKRVRMPQESTLRSRSSLRIPRGQQGPTPSSHR